MDNKYLGIMPYDENENYLFAGRANETWALYDRISRNDYTVYYAASGEGKSSLIRAGLLPILRRRDFFPIYIVFKEQEFSCISSFIEVLVSRIHEEENEHNVVFKQSSWSKLYFSEEQSEILKENAWWLLRNYSFWKGENELKPLFIFDQFEEVFTKASYQWTDSFFSWLEEISTDCVPESVMEFVNSYDVEIPTQKNFKALFSFRTEYLGDLDYWCVQKHFLPSLQDNRMCLKPLTPKGAREVIGLNEKILGVHASEIILGCSESNVKVTSEDLPCVSALILSVVCQTLSIVSNVERGKLLSELSIDQDGAIDNILLRFYKSKLRLAGLDYSKDTSIISALEQALVDKNGKRIRRDTDDKSIEGLSVWISQLCNPDNRLLKVIAQKESDGEIIKTIELPHDRLCKAIDLSRKEREKKKEWSYKRLAEWTQFGLLSAIIAIVCFLWNTMMDKIQEVMHCVISMDIHLLFNSAIREELCIAVLMVLLLLILPVLVFSTSRRKRGWSYVGLIFSFAGFIGFGGLLLSRFSNAFVIFVDILAFISCIGFFVSYLLKIINIKIKNNVNHIEGLSPSVWPLYGGIAIFLLYIFYELLFRVTFGINEQIESAWCVVVIPILFSLLIWNYLDLEINQDRISKRKVKILSLFFVLSLLVLCAINTLSCIDIHLAKFEFPIVILCLFLSILTSSLIYKGANSTNPFFDFTKIKRIVCVCLINIVIVIVFVLNLGYNPLCIRPSIVSHVYNWRLVVVHNNASYSKEYFQGFKDPLIGSDIVPCCISDFRNDSRFYVKKEYNSFPFECEKKVNSDNSFVYASDTILGSFSTSPVMESYVFRESRNDLSRAKDLDDSIKIVSAKFFLEIRNNNIEALLSGKSFDINTVKYIDYLDSLQYLAFRRQIRMLHDSVLFNVWGTYKRPLFSIMDDSHLIGLYRELARCMMVCLIRDRLCHKDVPALFTLSNTYPLVFFGEEEGISYSESYTNNSVVNNVKSGSQRYLLFSSDIKNNRLFSWYEIFDMLCSMDLSYNSSNINDVLKTSLIDNDRSGVEKINSKLNQSIDSIKVCISKVDNQPTIKGLLQTQLSTYEECLQLCDSLLDKLSNDEGIIFADQRLDSIKRETVECLFSFLNTNNNAIYNNAFESTIKNLILISLFRGHNVNDDIDNLHRYNDDKEAFYSTIMNQIEEVNKLSSKFKEVNNVINNQSGFYSLLYKLLERVDNAHE